jgi:serine/threonine-protein kinase
MEVDLSAGQRLDGRYLLLEKLGAGGMSVVWKAFDAVLDRGVAIKVLAQHRATDQESRGRIRAEAQAVAKLSHPNITSVHDYGEAADGDGTPVPFVVMELLDGQTLAERLREGPMSWREAASICAGVASGLAAAHARGLVHRDVKPSNVMLTPGGVKVVDFGLAGFAGSPESLEEDGGFYGTPAYLAPERLVNDVIVAATDVYALGLLLYLCLTNELPWNADTPTQMIRNHQYEAPAPLPKIDGLPRGVTDLCAACLAKDPNRRPKASEAARVLSAISTDEVVTAPEPRGFRGRRRLIGAIVTAVVVVVAVFAAIRLGTADRSSAAGTPLSCGVTFKIQPLGAGVFTAQIILANTGSRPIAHWSLRFVFQGRERIVAAHGAGWSQDGTTTTLTGQKSLPTGATVTIGLEGTGGSREFGPPFGFTVNGSSCNTGYGPPPPPPGGPPPPAGSPPPPRQPGPSGQPFPPGG